MSPATLAVQVTMALAALAESLPSWNSEPAGVQVTMALAALAESLPGPPRLRACASAPAAPALFCGSPQCAAAARCSAVLRVRPGQLRPPPRLAGRRREPARRPSAESSVARAPPRAPPRGPEERWPRLQPPGAAPEAAPPRRSPPRSAWPAQRIAAAPSAHRCPLAEPLPVPAPPWHQGQQHPSSLSVQSTSGGFFVARPRQLASSIPCLPRLPAWHAWSREPLAHNGIGHKARLSG
mmetsp:Transcript_70151/g.198865  ORF Transcript_70151/g.198865 Transcript_70151/m.198865 type:complete len:238 (-) Transcript_70151:37-750(-)